MEHSKYNGFLISVMFLLGLCFGLSLSTSSAYAQLAFDDAPPSSPPPKGCRWDSYSENQGWALSVSMVTKYRLACDRYAYCDAQKLSGRDVYLMDARNTWDGIAAGDEYDGTLYTQKPAQRANAVWRIQASSAHQCAFTITDLKHGQSIAAGTVSDGNAYHQPANGRPEAAWIFQALHESNNFRIIDAKHGDILSPARDTNRDDRVFANRDPSIPDNQRVWRLHDARTGEVLNPH